MASLKLRRCTPLRASRFHDAFASSPSAQTLPGSTFRTIRTGGRVLRQDHAQNQVRSVEIAARIGNNQ
jgi:hypothetical protein